MILSKIREFIKLNLLSWVLIFIVSYFRSYRPEWLKLKQKKKEEQSKKASSGLNYAAVRDVESASDDDNEDERIPTDPKGEECEEDTFAQYVARHRVDQQKRAEHQKAQLNSSKQ